MFSAVKVCGSAACVAPALVVTASGVADASWLESESSTVSWFSTPLTAVRPTQHPVVSSSAATESPVTVMRKARDPAAVSPCIRTA